MVFGVEWYRERLLQELEFISLWITVQHLLNWNINIRNIKNTEFRLCLLDLEILERDYLKILIEVIQ